MKIYIASSFSLITQVEKVARFLEAEGHEITVRWWARTYQVAGGQLVETQELKKQYADLTPDEFYSRPETMKSYLADLEGIEEADALVLVGPSIATRSSLVGGNVELGYGLALGIPCYGLGAFVNSAMYAGMIRCRTYGEFMLRLGRAVK